MNAIDLLNLMTPAQRVAWIREREMWEVVERNRAISHMLAKQERERSKSRISKSRKEIF